MKDPYSHEMLIEKFWEKVDKSSDPSGCWLWKATLLNSGYGQYSYNYRRRVLAHRFSYAEFVGPIPTGLKVCHRCDTPSCVRPSHLFVGTQKENAQDASFKGRLGGNHRRLDRNEARAVRDARHKGLSEESVALQFKVHIVTVRRIAGSYTHKEA